MLQRPKNLRTVLYYSNLQLLSQLRWREYPHSSTFRSGSASCTRCATRAAAAVVCWAGVATGIVVRLLGTTTSLHQDVHYGEDQQNPKQGLHPMKAKPTTDTTATIVVAMEQTPRFTRSIFSSSQQMPIPPLSEIHLERCWLVVATRLYKMAAVHLSFFNDLRHSLLNPIGQY